jgi:hypothetical protein
MQPLWKYRILCDTSFLLQSGYIILSSGSEAFHALNPIHNLPMFSSYSLLTTFYWTALVWLLQIEETHNPTYNAKVAVYEERLTPQRAGEMSGAL